MNDMQNLYICGFMGSGKTSMGQVLAAMTGKQFVDTDKTIEAREKMSISEIFETKGEDYFRQLELGLVTEIMQMQNLIVSVGGGFLLHDGIGEILKATGATILFIDENFENCYERIKDSDRPLVKGKTKEELKALYDERKEHYLSVSTDAVDPNEMMNMSMPGLNF